MTCFLLFLIWRSCTEHLKDSASHLFLFLLFANSPFWNQRIVPIFNHVLSSSSFKNFDNSGPLLPFWQGIMKNNQILSVGPLSVLFAVVKMVKPTLSAMLRSSKNQLARTVKDVLGDSVPLTRLDFLCSLDQQLIFLDCPSHPFSTLQQIQILEV